MAQHAVRAAVTTAWSGLTGMAKSSSGPRSARNDYLRSPSPASSSRHPGGERGRPRAGSSPRDDRRGQIEREVVAITHTPAASQNPRWPVRAARSRQCRDRRPWTNSTEFHHDGTQLDHQEQHPDPVDVKIRPGRPRSVQRMTHRQRDPADDRDRRDPGATTVAADGTQPLGGASGEQVQRGPQRRRLARGDELVGQVGDLERNRSRQAARYSASSRVTAVCFRDPPSAPPGRCAPPHSRTRRCSRPATVIR